MELVYLRKYICIVFLWFFLFEMAPKTILGADDRSQITPQFGISSGAYSFTTIYTLRNPKMHSELIIEVMAASRGSRLHVPGTFVPFFSLQHHFCPTVKDSSLLSRGEAEQNYQIYPGPFYVRLRFGINRAEHEVEVNPKANGMCTIANLHHRTACKWYEPLQGFSKQIAHSYLSLLHDEKEWFSKYKKQESSSYSIAPSQNSTWWGEYRLHFVSGPSITKTIPVEVITQIRKNSKGKKTLTAFASFQDKKSTAYNIPSFAIKFSQTKHGLKEISRKGAVQSSVWRVAIKKMVQMNITEHTKFHQLQEKISTQRNKHVRRGGILQ